MLAALKELKSQLIKFNWDSGAYAGLVNLQLDFAGTGVSISLLELVAVLSANPNLTVLKLSAIDIYSPEGWSYYPRVILCHLEDLSITFTKLESILPLIGLPTSPIKLRIGLTPRSPLEIQVQSFLLDSDVTSLYWYNWYGVEPAQVNLSILKQLRRLGSFLLHEYDITNELATFTDPSGFEPSSSPYLTLFALSECIVSYQSLDTLVKAYGVQELCLIKCVTAVENENLEVIQTMLEDAHPRLKCSVSNEDSRIKAGYGNKTYEKN